MNNTFWKINRIPSRLLASAAALVLTTTMDAQSLSIQGTVKDDIGEPLAGATVKLGGTNVAITDANGRFTVKADRGQILQVNYVGFETYKATIKNGAALNIVMGGDKELDEVVVVGYGTQKKSVVTAAIAKVSSEDLATTAPTRVDNALKGLPAGVQVTSNSGQPGAASRVRVRGIGTSTFAKDGFEKAADPIYIVDGMPIEGGIDYLNPNDIESIEVLKDAASGAIYGARAANGVILVTTKKGQQGKTQVTYDFSYGISNPWRKRDMLNATEYALLMNEGRLNAGLDPLYNDPYSYGAGTNWQKEIFNKNAADQRHQVALSGATDKVNYYLSVGYQDQEGIVGGNFDRSNYQRLSLRSNNNYTVFDHSKERKWMPKMNLIANVSYSNIKSKGIAENAQFSSPLGSALALSPIIPVFEVDPQGQKDQYGGMTGYTPVYSKDGQMYSLPGTAFGEMVNPIASLSLPGRQNWSHKFVTNFAGELEIYEGLKLRTSYSADMSFWGYDEHTILFYLRASDFSDKTSASSTSERGLVWQIENTLSYEKTINKHSFSALLGQSAKENNGYYLGATAYHLVDLNKPSVDYTTGLQENGERNGWGGIQPKVRLASMFARASYNYDERYMAQATIRRDGSSRFGMNNKWANFPSFSLGWNVMNEPWLQDRKAQWINNMKVRYSWGKNGNDMIGNFAYTVLANGGNNYLFGTNESVITGSKASGLANQRLRWEESIQHDLGIDFGFLNNALTFTVDYYKKITSGMLMEMNIPSYVGESKPTGNVGRMQNTGIEFEGAYKLRRGDWNFRVAGNISYLKNKLIQYGNESGWANLDSFQGMGAISRAENGMPFPYFYGYKTNGIFQNMDEVRSYTNAQGNMIQPTAVPGDIRFVDIDGDGSITAEDRIKIGKGTPDWSWGLNFNLSWKNLDFSMMWQGTIGNDIYDCTRRTDITRANLPSYMLNRWTGEGTSNKYPRFVLGDNVNWQSNDLLVYDGSYARLKNIQIGYTIPQRLTKKTFIEKLRVYASAENLWTLTKYHGFDPEISSGGTSLGIDYGVYPQARTFTVGVNVALGSAHKKEAKAASYEPEYVEKIVEKIVEKPVIKEVVKENTTSVQSTYVVTFKQNSYQIANTAELDGIAKGSNVEVVAYASPEGNADANKVLSQKRADAVADYLTSKGVKVSRVIAKGADSEHANRIAIVTIK